MSRPRPAAGRRARILAIVLTTLTSACLEEQCGLDGCDPSKQDCSLSTTCCTPPVPSPSPVAPLALACESTSRDGSRFFDVDLVIRGGASPYRYVVTFDDGNSSDGTRNGRPDEATEISVSHQYEPRPGTEPTAYTVQATVTDQQNQAASCTVSHLVDPQRLDLDCEVTPRSGTVPLLVTFAARPNGCIGPCEITWDFGDGESTMSRHAVHLYTAPGVSAFSTYPAGATVDDGPDRSYRCFRAVEVLPAMNDPLPAPSNRAPVITGFTATPATLFSGGPPAALVAVVSDPDGDPVAWTLSLDPSSTATGTFTPASGLGDVSAQFAAAPVPGGPAILRLVVSDGRGGTATATVTVNVILS